MNTNYFSKKNFLNTNFLLGVLVLVKLLIHFFTNGQYGYFRDELYYLACSEHPDIGYVDQPPFIVYVTLLTRWLFGDSLFSLRFFPAVAGAVNVLLTGLIARQLGGGRFAQSLAALTVIIAPVILGVNSLLTMNAFDQLFWTLGFYILILILKNNNHKLWLWFGLVAGIGLMNKLTILFFGFGVFTAFLFTPQRRHLLNKWPWIAGILSFVILTPFIIWQTWNDWATLEFYGIYGQAKTYPASFLEFIYMQVFTIHPFSLPVWLAGLYYFVRSKDGSRYRPMGYIYIILFFLIFYLEGKFYHLSPAYTILLASGAVMIEKFSLQRKWFRPAYTSVLIIGGMLTAPMAIPVLPVDTFIRYTSSTGGSAGVKMERLDEGKLPQIYADMFGWENMAETVAGVYHSLTPEEQAKCCISTGNYGEAAAIDFFGKKYNLPEAISGHNSYYLWGPGDCTGEVVISIGSRLDDLVELFEQVEEAAVIQCDYCMPYENNLPVYICRGLKIPIKEAWRLSKAFG